MLPAPGLDPFPSPELGHRQAARAVPREPPLPLPKLLPIHRAGHASPPSPLEKPNRSRLARHARVVVVCAHSTVSYATSCWTAKSSSPSWKRRCSSVVCGRRTTPSARTARWGIDPRPRSRAAPVRLVRLRLTKRTGAIPWQVYPGDRHWVHSWGQVSCDRESCPFMVPDHLSEQSAKIDNVGC
jgi:hypothetical protein